MAISTIFGLTIPYNNILYLTLYHPLPDCKYSPVKRVSHFWLSTPCIFDNFYQINSFHCGIYANSGIMFLDFFIWRYWATSPVSKPSSRWSKARRCLIYWTTATTEGRRSCISLSCTQTPMLCRYLLIKVSRHIFNQIFVLNEAYIWRLSIYLV